LSAGIERRRETLHHIGGKANTKRRRSLLAITVPQSLRELKSLLQHLDKALAEKAYEWARQQYKAILEAVDSQFAKSFSWVYIGAWL
jgi:hypothetical protein